MRKRGNGGKKDERLTLAELFELQAQKPSDATLHQIVARLVELFCSPSPNGDLEALLTLRFQYPEILERAVGKALQGVPAESLTGNVLGFLQLYKRLRAAQLPAWELEEALLDIREEAKEQSLGERNQAGKDQADSILQAFAKAGLVGVFANLARRRKQGW